MNGTIAPASSSNTQAARAPLKALIGGALADVMAELGPQFERASGIKLDMAFAPTPQLITWATSDAPFDLAIAPIDMLRDSAIRAYFEDAPPTNIARVGYSVAIREGLPLPDLSTPEAFKTALLAARSVTFLPDSAAGSYVLKAFDHLGIRDVMADKTIAQKVPKDIARAVATGDADLGIFLTHVLTGEGVQLAGPFPTDLQHELVFIAAVARRAGNAASAHALIKFLQTDEAAKTIRACGMQTG